MGDRDTELFQLHDVFSYWPIHGLYTEIPTTPLVCFNIHLDLRRSLTKNTARYICYIAVLYVPLE